MNDRLDPDTLRYVIALIRMKEGAPGVDAYLWGYGTQEVREELEELLERLS
jgi:hypothetical protein